MRQKSNNAGLSNTVVYTMTHITKIFKKKELFLTVSICTAIIALGGDEVFFYIQNCNK